MDNGDVDLDLDLHDFDFVNAAMPPEDFMIYWAKFKQDLISSYRQKQSLPVNFSSFILAELASSNHATDDHCPLSGLKADELRWLDEILVWYEDKCLPILLVKYERYKLLCLKFPEKLDSRKAQKHFLTVLQLTSTFCYLGERKKTFLEHIIATNVQRKDVREKLMVRLAQYDDLEPEWSFDTLSRAGTINCRYSGKNDVHDIASVPNNTLGTKYAADTLSDDLKPVQVETKEDLKKYNSKMLISNLQKPLTRKRKSDLSLMMNSDASVLVIHNRHPEEDALKCTATEEMEKTSCSPESNIITHLSTKIHQDSSDSNLKSMKTRSLEDLKNDSSDLCESCDELPFSDRTSGKESSPKSDAAFQEITSLNILEVQSCLSQNVLSTPQKQSRHHSKTQKRGKRSECEKTNCNVSVDPGTNHEVQSRSFENRTWLPFNNQAEFERHKGVFEEYSKTFSCNICGASFTYKSHLNVHKRVHSGEKPFKCDLCKASFPESSKLKNHRRIHSGEKPYICDECGSSFTLSSGLKSHKKIHSKVKSFKCDTCSFTAAHSSSLKTHMKIHTGEKKYACEHCGASFCESAKLRRHMMVHTGERPFSCEVCGTRFADKSHLTVHLRIHSGEKPFRCTQCTSSFAESSKLKNHMRTHTKEKPYICEICGSSFAVSYGLKSHMRRHTGEKPYRCDICGYATSQSSNLKTHLSVHSGNKPHTCDECGASFTELSKLNRHKKIHVDPYEEMKSSKQEVSRRDETEGLIQTGSQSMSVDNCVIKPLTFEAVPSSDINQDIEKTMNNNFEASFSIDSLSSAFRHNVASDSHSVLYNMATW